jgi:TRAP-type C4-dicarboxylate transport system substrate-binding protein
MVDYKRLGLAAVVVGAMAYGVTSPASAEIDEREFKVVGTWHFLSQWKNHESRLWNDVLPAASGGKITANARPLTELGMKGFELMRQLKVGVFDFAHGVTSYVASDAPAIEGVDLAGVVQDLPTYRRVMESYRGILEREFDQRFNSTILMLYAFPSQQVWCNLKDRSITELSFADLKGKKIRTYSTTLGDFIEGLGASAVTIAFSEVVPALQKGVADCGITGTMPAYTAKWWQVVTHNFRIRLGYASAFLAVNNKVWNSLSADTQALMMANFKEVEDAMWVDTEKEDQEGMDCNASGPCAIGEPGGMVPIEASDADRAQLKVIVNDFVLKRWVKRCGKKCAVEWDATIGKVMGMTAPQ